MIHVVDYFLLYIVVMAQIRCPAVVGEGKWDS